VAEEEVTVAEEEVTVAEEEVTVAEEEVLVVMDLADLPQLSAGGHSVHDSQGRVDLRSEVFLVGETTVDSVIVVSAGATAISAIGGFAILIGTFSVLASMALDTHITIHTTITRITIHIRITATVPI
jgi:hypothetical protein